MPKQMSAGAAAVKVVSRLVGFSWVLSPLTVFAQAMSTPAAAGQRAVGSSLTVDHRESGKRTVTLPSQAAVKGAAACSSARVIKLDVTSPTANIGEPALIELAMRTGKPLRLENAQCAAGGVMTGSKVALEPEAVVLDPCSLPAQPVPHPDCRKPR